MHLSDPHSGLMVTTGRGRRGTAHRLRPGAGQPAAGHRPGDRGQLRRRGHQHRRRPRGGQPGGPVGPAGPLRLPAQPVRGAHPVRRLHPHRAAGRALRRLRHGGGDRRRQQRARDVRGRRRGGAPGPGGGGARPSSSASPSGWGPTPSAPAPSTSTPRSWPGPRRPSRWPATGGGWSTSEGCPPRPSTRSSARPAEAVEVAVAAALAADPPGPERAAPRRLLEPRGPARGGGGPVSRRRPRRPVTPWAPCPRRSTRPSTWPWRPTRRSSASARTSRTRRAG